MGECSICKAANQPLSRKYYHYDVKCDCCGDGKHFEIVRYCNSCAPKPPDKISILSKPIDDVAKAVEVITREMEKDKSEGSYYYSWQANIAMAFKDEWSRRIAPGAIPMGEDIHNVSNQAAKNFLDLLCKK